jgi:hypothetical protein
MGVGDGGRQTSNRLLVRGILAGAPSRRLWVLPQPGRSSCRGRCWRPEIQAIVERINREVTACPELRRKGYVVGVGDRTRSLITVFDETRQQNHRPIDPADQDGGSRTAGF